jgi:hypothetical protein
MMNNLSRTRACAIACLLALSVLLLPARLGHAHAPRGRAGRTGARPGHVLYGPGRVDAGSTN